MRKILAAVLLLMAASFAAQSQTCVFTASQDQTNLRLFKLTVPANTVFNFGDNAPAAPNGVFWKPAGGTTETRMDVKSWSRNEVSVSLPVTLPVCQGAYTITLKLPGMTTSCSFPIILTADRAPNGSDPACTGLPAPCVLTATPAAAQPGGWVALSTVPSGSIRQGDTVKLTCLATGVQTTLTVTAQNGQLGVTLPAQGLNCDGGQYSIQAGQCQTVISVLSTTLPAANCDALRWAAAFYLRLRLSGSNGPGQPLAARLVNPNGVAIPQSITLPGIPGLVMISSVQWAVSEDAGGTRPLTPNGDYVERDDDSQHSATFTLAPPVVERVGGSQPQPVRRYLRVTVSLAAALPTGRVNCAVTLTGSFNLSPLPVPRVLALFRRANFDAGHGVGNDTDPNNRAVMVMVRAGALNHLGRPLSGLSGPDGLVSELNWIVSVLPSVPSGSAVASSPLANFAAFALGLSSLNAKLSAVASDATYKQYYLVADSVANLRDIHMIPGGHPYAEDLFDSLMYVGPPRSRVSFFNNQQFASDQGAFDLKLNAGSFFASVSDLSKYTADPGSDAAAAAAGIASGGTVTVTARPGGPKYALFGNEIWGDDFCCHQAQSFGAEISSIRFNLP